MHAEVLLMFSSVEDTLLVHWRCDRNGLGKIVEQSGFIHVAITHGSHISEVKADLNSWRLGVVV